VRAIPRIIASITCIAALATATALAGAQSFPSKTIEFIVPFAPGGSTDTVSRMLAQKMSETFGQPAIVNNRPGGGSIIGTALAAKAPPDGHTILAQTIAFAINAAAKKNLPYDPIKSFTPIAELSTLPLMLVVHPSLPVNSVQELVAMAKQKPGQLNYASSGSGTSPHLAAEMFKSMAGVDMIHIPFKGNAEASNALLGGHVPIYFALVPPFLAHVKSGALRALAVTTERRIDSLPHAPTIAELGYAGFEISSWQGLFVPAGTPPAAVARLNSEVGRIINLPEVRARIEREGATPVAGTAEQFGAKVASEIAKWKRVIEQSGAKLD
jgi:tripartite-type tricarboxylate transporter receptor subunit TctC